MFKKFLQSITVAMYLVAISVPAFIARANASTSVYSNEAGWDISVTDTGNCVMTKYFDAGTKFVVGYMRESQGFWFGVGREDWTVVQNQRYRIGLWTDSGGNWKATFTGYQTETHGAYLSEGNLTKPFIVTLAKSNWIELYNPDNGRTFRRLSLVGSYDGLVGLFNCQDQQGWQRRMPSQQAPQVYYH